MTSKQRAYLRGLSNDLAPILQIGKGSVTPEIVTAVEEAFHTRELLKISVLKNCTDDPNDLADLIAERAHAQVVAVIGKKIVLYKRDRDNPKIVLPAGKKGDAS